MEIFATSTTFGTPSVGARASFSELAAHRSQGARSHVLGTTVPTHPRLTRRSVVRGLGGTTSVVCAGARGVAFVKQATRGYVASTVLDATTVVISVVSEPIPALTDVEPPSGRCSRR